MRPLSAFPSTAVPPIGPAPASGRRAFAGFRRSTRPYNYEMGVDLREQMTLVRCRRRVFTIPGNIEKTFDQITRAVSHVASAGAFR